MGYEVGANNVAKYPEDNIIAHLNNRGLVLVKIIGRSIVFNMKR